MGAPYFMGIDIGSSETKGLILDGACNIIAQCATRHRMENPRTGYFEHDAEAVWWKDFCIVSKGLLEQSGIPPDRIACVAASTLGSDCLPVDAHCRPLRKAILYGIDSRQQSEIEWLTRTYGEDTVRRAFHRNMASDDVAGKILWIKRNEPEVYSQTYKFLTGSSYITAKLTGQYVIDQFLAKASFKPMYIDDGSVDSAFKAAFCRPDQLAEPRYVHEVVGAVTEQAARETGLAKGTPVTTGTGDSAAEAVSTGILAPGDMMLQFGSTLFIYYCADRLISDDRVRGSNFLIPDTFSVAGGTNTAGTLTQWYRDNLFADLVDRQEALGANAYDLMLQGVDAIPPGSDGLITLPYFAGERTPINDPNALGVVFGLKLSHTRAHLYRSALESVAYAVAQHVDVLREHKLPLRKIMAVGGGTKTLPWMQMVADVLGQPVHIAQITVGASFGDALIAAIGAGHFKGFSDLERVTRAKTTIRPDGDRHAAYRPYLQMYSELYRRNKDLMHKL